jgi:DNA-binding transcriptional ArsR family regulator
MRPKRGQKQIGAVSRAEVPEGKMRGGSGAFLGKQVEGGVAFLPYFCNNRNMKKADPALVTRSALRFSALGAEPRLQILRLLLAAHPEGMVVGEVQEEMGIPASTLSHHLEKLKQVGLVKVRREGTYLWYAADTDALREVLNFLYEECCTRSRAVPPEAVVQISR